jgi:hypothetical protein
MDRGTTAEDLDPSIGPPHADPEHLPGALDEDVRPQGVGRRLLIDVLTSAVPAWPLPVLRHLGVSLAIGVGATDFPMNTQAAWRAPVIERPRPTTWMTPHELARWTA